MRVLRRWLIRGLLALVLAVVAIGIFKREEIMRLMAVNSLFSESKIVRNFSHMNDAFLFVDIPRGNLATSELPYGPDTSLPPRVDQWIKDRDVTALVVLKGGEIVFEEYYLGTTEKDRRISWSVAKSFLSALFGVLVDEGVINSLDDPVTKYVPALIGGAYDSTTILNVLNMTSGVAFDEDYLDYNSDINRMGRVLALGGRMDDFATDLNETFIAPGQQWQYVSIDTHVLGMVVRRATGRSIPDLLSEKIIAPLGFEQAPYYLSDGAGVAFVLGGLNMITRDYARFGQMILQNGEYGGQQIVPVNWIRISTAPTAPTAPGKLGYGYQWWVPKDASVGEFMGRGIYGQYLYIDQEKGVVIATNAADRRFRDPGITDQNIAVFRTIADSL
ncbi:MAG: serine hydrolase [Paracoccaceae bacterium]